MNLQAIVNAPQFYDVAELRQRSIDVKLRRLKQRQRQTERVATQRFIERRGPFEVWSDVGGEYVVTRDGDVVSRHSRVIHASRWASQQLEKEAV